MTSDQMAAILARRMLAASTPFGRARLQFYMGWKRLAWRITIGCTAFSDAASISLHPGCFCWCCRP